MSTIQVNFAQKTGKRVMPLHGVNSGPMTKVFTYNAKPQFIESGIPFVRLHDVEYPYGSGEFVDIPCVFKNFNADENDPASYNFANTDEYIRQSLLAGSKIIFRLGVSIEHSPHKRYIDPLKQAGKKVLYTSDGTYDEFIDDIAACHFDGFVLEPTTDMAYIAEKYGKTHAFVGNADTRILLNGTREDIENEVKRCMDIGKKCPGFIMAVGNHIPPNTPVENALWYNECFEKMRRR